ncbi:PREDICTED: nematode resistance protein-like HSPRO1 [Camelina sativa]|uniref:Nematode resistance protein-like HSPRO1 n=1 Tax=Camelina sativa TaxID=90675 RepID=A0ABM0ZIE6_CAMSA|nr:PREDICTED: nematode resistance protein-like HSPRO1 [Camelina sativa]
MADLDLQRRKMPSPNKLHVTIPEPCKLSSVSSPISSASSAACSAYELYLRLPELRILWSSIDYPRWISEPVLKPSLQALEITFRLILTVASDTRPYVNRREWIRRLDSLSTSQIKLVAAICEDDNYYDDGNENVSAAPVSNGWSSLSLLSEIATCRTSESIGQKILSTIENEMRWCKYTLGLGEPNLAGKPYLQYDAVCRPEELHSLKNNPYSDHIENQENQMLYTIHQILESWIYVSVNLLNRIESTIEDGKFEKASFDVYLLERIWKLLAEIEDLHILMDPEDFLKVKKQLQIKSTSQDDAFCFWSKGLVEMAKMSKELRQKVPAVLEVEVDPTGGPRLQEAAMKLYSRKTEYEKIHLLQGMQAVESAAKRFFFGYQKLVATMMGSAEANANRTAANHESCDSLTQVFMEPPYYPSLDAAKTFLGEFWNQLGCNGRH